MIETDRRRTPDQIVRFLMVGGFNTVITGVLYLALSQVTAPASAFTIAFLAGIALAVIVTPRLVFSARATGAQRVRYLAWYVTIYAIGLGSVFVLHDLLQLNNMAVAAGTFAATASLSFLGARLVFAVRPGHAMGSPDR